MKITNLVLVLALSAGTITVQAQNSPQAPQAPNTAEADQAPQAPKTETSVPSVTIGTQTWMQRNLDVVTFRNGDTIPQAAGDSAWMAAAENETPAWCYYNNDPANGAVYGKLYNWFALKDTRGLAPLGWHLPSDQEWTLMINTLDTSAHLLQMGGAESVKAGPLLKTAEGWKEEAVEANNSSGFTALPAGYRVHWNIEKTAAPFFALTESANWWSSTPTAGTDAWLRNVYYKNNQVKKYFFHRGYGFSVRCIQGELEDFWKDNNDQNK
jgi:uncharacterized protein (TIGR02145 family)